jgi:hypothetical protein
VGDCQPAQRRDQYEASGLAARPEGFPHRCQTPPAPAKELIPFKAFAKSGSRSFGLGKLATKIKVGVV